MKQASYLKVIGGISFALLFSTGITQAGLEKLPSKEEPGVQLNPPEQIDWSGLYVGGSVGAIWTNQDFSRYDVSVDLPDQFVRAEEQFFGPNMVRTIFVGNNQQVTLQQDSGSEFDTESFSFGNGFNGSSGFGSQSDDSLLGGGQIGYQKQFGHWVLGVEADFQRAANTHSVTGTGEQTQTTVVDQFSPIFLALQSDTSVTSERKTQMNWTGSARGKFGYARGPVLFYVIGGLAFAQVDAWAVDTANSKFNFLIGFINIPITSASIGTISDTNISRDDAVLTGWTAGVGGEYAFNEMFSMGLEYRHSDFGDHTFHFDSHGGAVGSGDVNVSLNADQVVFKVNVNLCTLFGFRH